MKTSALRALRRKLAANSPVYGLWVTLESPSVTEIAVALGLDWVVIDAEHGHLDWKEIVEHLRATVRSDTVALVRVASLDAGLIKRALDIGADGVVIPWVESAEQFRQAVSFARYSPEGVRGIGAERATCWGQCFVE
ncbi:MAG TPA: aldolase/citrate lyase family protein, partial [Planctomycetaceae bacterium]|nr:aldolase/citrate lyase family protein [Planctomycetaceae bacterium]